MEKFELYVLKPNGKLIGVRNTKELAPLDKDGDRMWIRVYRGPSIVHKNQSGKYKSPRTGKSITQTPFDLGTGSKYANYPVVSNVAWKQVFNSNKEGPYGILERWIKKAIYQEFLNVHTVAFHKDKTTIKSGTPLFKLADLATIRKSLVGTGIEVDAPHLHANVAVSDVSQDIAKWLKDGTKKHISEITKPVTPKPPVVVDPCQEKINKLETEYQQKIAKQEKDIIEMVSTNEATVRYLNSTISSLKDERGKYQSLYQEARNELDNQNFGYHLKELLKYLKEILKGKS